ncbi:MAG: 4'-phosphopantetheinyl transferase superfamily protein [Blastocatellales bacterium]
MTESRISNIPMISINDWATPPKALALCREEVHVWRVSLNQPESEVQESFRLLNPDERERASRFRFPQSRDHFAVARGALRVILGRYLDTPPERLRFRYNAFGKPALENEPAGGDLRFNLSHSHGLALCAITFGCEIGVDVEWMRADLAGEETIAKYFSNQEAETIRKLPPELRTQAFFDCWTRKEAFIKAVGEGLSYPLDQFTVTVTPGQPARLLNARGGEQEAGRWSLAPLNCGDGYAAAVAVEGRIQHIRGYDYDRQFT